MNLPTTRVDETLYGVSIETNPASKRERASPLPSHRVFLLLRVPCSSNFAKRVQGMQTYHADERKAHNLARKACEEKGLCGIHHFGFGKLSPSRSNSW